MLSHLLSLLTVVAAAVLLSGGPTLAQYSTQGHQPDVRNYPIPFAERNRIDQDDYAGDPRTPPPPVSQRRGDLRPRLPSRPDLSLDEWGPPVRPPGDINFDRPPNQASSPGAAAPRRALPHFASLPPEDQPELGGPKELPPQFKRQLVNYETKEPAGTIVIDTSNTFLYLVLGNGKALRYGIGVGREGFAWSGAERISRMALWPDWHPPAEMIERQPYLPRFMAGGEGNPLGARALYLGKTLYRIHGTNQPSTIGTFVSSGCIRLVNEDIEDLYGRVQVGARVVVLQR